VAEITETEKVVPEIRRVQLGAARFRIPPSPTVHFMLYVRRLLQKFQDGDVGDDDILGCFDEVVDFLELYNKDVDRDQLERTCEIAELIGFCTVALGAQADDETDGEDEVPPSRPARRGTTGARKSSSKRSVSST
jgi:hypothetical protein